MFITTKVWWTNFSAGALEKSVAESLARLKLPFVDLLLLHWPNTSVPLQETLGSLSKVKREGLTRHIGISNFTVALVEQAVALADEPIVNNQIELHPYIDQSRVIAACRRRGISVTAYSPIARGAVKGDQVLEKVGRAHNKSAAQVCLRYLVQQGIIAIPRTSRVERLAKTSRFSISSCRLPRWLKSESSHLRPADGSTILGAGLGLVTPQVVRNYLLHLLNSLGTFVLRRKLNARDQPRIRANRRDGDVSPSLRALPELPAAPLGGTAMQTNTQQSYLPTILWTAGALAIVVVFSVYMGMS